MMTSLPIQLRNYRALSDRSEQTVRTASPHLSWQSNTGQDSMDELARPLKVATRVRIPLGLQRRTSSEGYLSCRLGRFASRARDPRRRA